MIPREDNYCEIMILFLSGYYVCCRQKFNFGRANEWVKNEHEKARAYEDIYAPNKSPVEQLMLETIYLVLSIRRGRRQFFSDTQETICEILKKNKIEDLLSILPENESLEFKTDLWLCGLYRKTEAEDEIKKMLMLIRRPLMPLLQRNRAGLSFIIEDILSEEGVYGEIILWLLEHYYHYCRIKLASDSPWIKGEWELYYAYYQLQPVFTAPLEQLILEAALLILDAGRSPLAFQERHRERVRKLLERHDFMSIAIEKLPEIGASELASDLSSLGFWNYKKFSERLESHYS